MTKVDQKMFNAIKLMLAGGAKNVECCEYMKLSASTVKMIKAADTFEEYRNMIAAIAYKSKHPKPHEQEKKPEQKPEPQVIEHRQTVTVQATWQMTQEMRKTNELLESISKKLAFIVDELIGTPKKEEAKNG